MKKKKYENNKKIKITPKKDRQIIPKESSPTTWDPFELIDSMNRFFFDDPWSSYWPIRHRRAYPFFPWHEFKWPSVDMKETMVDLVDNGDSYKLIAEMPGISKKDIEVSITETDIKICGETQEKIKDDSEGYIRHERSYSSLCKKIKFPEEVNPNKAEANLKDGILEIFVDKKQPNKNKGRKVPVK
jgi:HSP20 family protein